MQKTGLSIAFAERIQQWSSIPRAYNQTEYIIFHGWQTIKKTLWLIVRWGIAVAAFVYLLSEGMFSLNHFTFSSGSLPWLLCSLACVLVMIFGTAVRFFLVLRQMEQSSRFWSIVRMFFEGMILLLVGSNFAFDGMRLVVLHKQGITPAMVGSSVLVDRLFGVSTIFLLALCVTIYYQNINVLFWPILGCLAAFAAIPLLFIAFRHFFGASSNAWVFCIPGSRLALEMGEALELLARRPLQMVLLSVFSFLPYLAILFVSYCNSRALGMELSCGEAMAGSVIAALIDILPLPFSGIGVGESTFGWVVSVLRGGGEIVNYAPVLFISRLFFLAVGCVSWVALTCIDSVASRLHIKHW